MHFSINRTHSTSKRTYIIISEIYYQRLSLMISILGSIKIEPVSNHHKVVTTIKTDIFKSSKISNRNPQLGSVIKSNLNLYTYLSKEPTPHYILSTHIIQNRISKLHNSIQIKIWLINSVHILVMVILHKLFHQYLHLDHLQRIQLKLQINRLLQLQIILLLKFKWVKTSILPFL